MLAALFYAVLSCCFELLQPVSLVLAKRFLLSVLRLSSKSWLLGFPEIGQNCLIGWNWRGRACTCACVNFYSSNEEWKPHFPFLSPCLPFPLTLKKPWVEGSVSTLAGCLSAYLLVWGCEGESTLSAGTVRARAEGRRDTYIADAPKESGLQCRPKKVGRTDVSLKRYKTARVGCWGWKET